jgi:tubulin polyglutamylase TTLL9
MFLISKHGTEAVNQLFADIQQVIIRSLLAVQRIMINDRHCFEMYGYDILVDSNLKPWLLEVNAAPSLSADTEADHELKYGVLDDVLTVIDFDHK